MRAAKMAGWIQSAQERILARIAPSNGRIAALIAPTRWSSLAGYGFRRWREVLQISVAEEGMPRRIREVTAAAGR
jgi:hypothetical protein